MKLTKMNLKSLFVTKKHEKRLSTLTEEINHFLLYGEHPEETLEEGPLANLTNQIRKLEEQLLYERNVSQNREQEFTHFIENMAHQMKTTVTALQLRLDLAQMQHGEADEALLKSQQCLERLTKEINDILNSSQLASGKITMDYETFSLNELLTDCCSQLLYLAAKKNVCFEMSTPDNIELYGDPFWLYQAIENILKNAIEHTKINGNVRITLENHGGNIHLHIQDQGDGILPEELPRLFQRFHRGDFNKTGYGIGLSMAYDIVNAHHGTLTAGNLETEKGAYFLITLPQFNKSAIYPK